MRKSKVSLSAVLLLVGLAAVVVLLAIILFLVRWAEQSDPPQAVVLEVVEVEGSDADNASMLSDLTDLDSAWALESSEAVAALLAEYEETEAKRQELAKLQAEERAEFLLKMQDLAAQQAVLQEQLDTKAEQEIAAMGGTNATKDDEVIVSEEDLYKPTPTITPQPVVDQDTEDYFGQFNAKFVCTCASCFKQEDWPDVYVGASYVLADPTFIPSGTGVKFDQGIISTFIVKDAKGVVTGRNVIVFSPNHSETNGGMQLFPKIYREG